MEACVLTGSFLAQLKSFNFGRVVGWVVYCLFVFGWIFQNAHLRPHIIIELKAAWQHSLSSFVMSHMYFVAENVARILQAHESFKTIKKKTTKKPRCDLVLAAAIIWSIFWKKDSLQERQDWNHLNWCFRGAQMQSCGNQLLLAVLVHTWVWFVGSQMPKLSVPSGENNPRLDSIKLNNRWRTGTTSYVS